MTAKPKRDDLLVDIDNISYVVNDRGDGKTLLRDVSFQIHKHDIISLIGPNGAGKSTLVKLLLGLIAPSQGVITRHANMIGYVPQKFVTPLILPLRVMDLLKQATGKFSPEQRQTIYDILVLDVLLPRQVAKLSGGEMQRVLLARALLERPDLLVLDEPMQGLDPQAQQHLYGLIDALPDFLRCAMLVVSHDLNWVMKGTKQVICLNKHICCMGTPIQIAKHDNFIDLYGRFDVHSHHHEVPYIHTHTHCHHTPH